MSRIYSVCEISENDGKNGKPVWIIIKGVVYDVTTFLNEHPGGNDLLLEYAGKDATKAFNDVGHSIDAIQDMKLYKIGIIDTQFSKRVIPTISMTGTKVSTETTEQCCSKKKKRLKLFFCF